jgi:mRNA (2'-O-methyladenosine-N6-)-methyltransferase
MSDNELKIVVTTALKSLLSSHKLNTPVASTDLLTSVMTTKMPLGLLPDGIRTPRFRLTDQSRFEKILEDLAQTWTEGKIVISRDDGSKKLMIWEVVLQNGLMGSFSSYASGSGTKKRKRVVDEDADSAVGDEESYLDEEEDNARDSRSSFANLSKEMREVYTILQKSTAKGRLLAEQVCLLVMFFYYYNHYPLVVSSVLLKNTLNLSAVL